VEKIVKAFLNFNKDTYTVQLFFFLLTSADSVCGRKGPQLLKTF